MSKFIILLLAIILNLIIVNATSYSTYKDTLIKDQRLEVNTDLQNDIFVTITTDLLSSNTEFNFNNCEKQNFETSFSNQQYSILNKCRDNFDFTVTKKVDNIYIKADEITRDSKIDVHGTEYEITDVATIFLQLRDSQGFPVNNATCSVTVYFPLRNTSEHDVFLENSPMLQQPNSAGIYYIDILTLPANTFGVYMISASCSFATSTQFIYATDGTDPNFPSRTTLDGDYNGSTIQLNSYTDSLYTTCGSDTGSTKDCNAFYDFNLTGKINNASDVNQLNLFYMGEASATATMTFYVFNWTSNDWEILPNTLLFGGFAINEPTGQDDFVSNIVPVNDTIVNNTLRIRTHASHGSSFTEYSNWLNVNLITAFGNTQDLRGSGEMHISGRPTTFTVASCPQTITAVIILALFLIIALVLILIALINGLGFLGVFGSLILMVLSWYLAGCIGILAFAVAGISIVMIIYFVVVGLIIK